MESSIVTRPPGTLHRLLIPETVLRNTIVGLSYGAGREMLCYWLGVAVNRDGKECGLVTTVAYPKVESSYAQFRLLEGQMGLITSWCANRQVWVLAQVHTHPTDEPHSEADECWPASHRKGFLSVVFPFFASMASVRNPGWRAYECQGSGVWDEIVPDERFEILPDIWLPA